MDTLPPSTGERLSCTGRVLRLCHHSDGTSGHSLLAALTPWQGVAFFLLLHTFRDADLEKQSVGGPAYSKFVQGHESVN